MSTGPRDARLLSLGGAKCVHSSLRFAQPIFSGSDLGEDQLVSRILPTQGNVRSGVAQHGYQPLYAFYRNNRIASAGADQKPRVRKRGPGLWRQRDHGPEENGRRERFRPKQKDRRCDVRAVGITDRGQRSRSETVFRRCSRDKVSQLMRAPSNVFFVKNAFSQPSEKSRHSIFQHVPAQAEDGSGRIEIAPERDHIVLVAARSMQKQKNAPRRCLLRRNEAVRVIHRSVELSVTFLR
jgi:hypothetical protein